MTVFEQLHQLSMADLYAARDFYKRRISEIEDTIRFSSLLEPPNNLLAARDPLERHLKSIDQLIEAKMKEITELLELTQLNKAGYGQG